MRRPLSLKSFEGELTIRLSEVGERFSRYTSTVEGRGSFLAKEKFSTPEETVRALYLKPYNNSAVYRQEVIVKTPSLVIEGGVNNGKPGIRQTLVIDRDAFNYGKGEKY